MRDFRALLDRIDGAQLTRPDAQIAFVVTAYLDNRYPFTAPEDGPTAAATLMQAYVSARHAGLPVGFLREADATSWKQTTIRDLDAGVQHRYSGDDEPMDVGPGLPDDATLYLIPSTKHLTSPTWVRLEELAHAGKSIYASYFLGVHSNQRGPWWPNMHELFGVKKLTRYGLVDVIEDETVEFTFTSDFGGIAAGTTLTWRTAGTENSRAYLPVELDGAEVIAVDGHGRPALLRNRLGEGQAILSTYPIEHMAAVSAAVNPDATALLYAALAAEAGVLPDLRVEGTDVIVGEMEHADGTRYVWLINMTDGETTATPTGAELVTLGGESVGQVVLSPFGVEVVRRA